MNACTEGGVEQYTQLSWVSHRQLTTYNHELSFPYSVNTFSGQWNRLSSLDTYFPNVYQEAPIYIYSKLYNTDLLSSLLNLNAPLNNYIYYMVIVFLI